MPFAPGSHQPEASRRRAAPLTVLLTPPSTLLTVSLTELVAPLTAPFVPPPGRALDGAWSAMVVGEPPTAASAIRTPAAAIAGELDPLVAARRAEVGAAPGPSADSQREPARLTAGEAGAEADAGPPRPTRHGDRKANAAPANPRATILRRHQASNPLPMDSPYP